MYIILLNKLKFDQIVFSERSGTLSEYGVPKFGTRSQKGWEPLV